MRSRSLNPLFLAFLLLPLVTAGCSSVDLWPFGGDGAKERSRVPVNATEFQCDGGKRFYLRYQDNGGSAWVMLPERQFRLDKVASAQGAHYSNGTATLEVNGAEASLNDGPANSFAGCKSGTGERAATR